MVDPLVKIADNYSIHYNDALSRFCMHGVIDDTHQAELEVSLKFIIEKVQYHLHNANKQSHMEEVKRLEEELAKLDLLWDAITNPDITPIMEG